MAEQIHAEIVAKVIEVARGEGADLVAGEAVLVLESMKMEIPVLTGIAGRLSRVAVRVGDVVQEGDLLAVVEGA
ncbi:biotin/lipoyl-binding carrier protein [Amycolatopsis endophytica]|uniref:Biotin carboxyl carrier protein n=1 Tax=Amycolatopsis endophytica TaxID=860233 RepID=A0A853BAG8_9PSEU|nr:biotin/lipoyl-binding carrier protein [Amycolatopsis endophytica]NYI91742.1 biotin carboxyl carrier protein [Amycolatopsis endophytica]